MTEELALALQAVGTPNSTTASSMVLPSVRIWLYCDAVLDGMGAVNELAAGWVFLPAVEIGLPGSAAVVGIASSEKRLRELIERDGDIFVPVGHIENVDLVSDDLSRYKGCLWLEDCYVSRYQLARRLPSQLLEHRRAGLVGTQSTSTLPFLSTTYAYLVADHLDVGKLAEVLRGGVENIWLPTSSESRVRRDLRIIADVVEASVLTRLFGGASASELERNWEDRLCLAARYDLPKGHRITPEKLVVSTGIGGLSPGMRDKVTGRRLRYSVSAGEVLTFGLLEC